MDNFDDDNWTRSEVMRARARNLRHEFEGYAAQRVPPENPIFHHDQSVEFGPQLSAARLNYLFFPFGGRFCWSGDRENPPLPTLEYIREWWGTHNDLPMTCASLGASRVVVVSIAANNMDGFETLASLESRFGQLPRTRIVQTPEGFDVHMRGVAANPAVILGPGLRLIGKGKAVALPGTRGNRGDFRWVRVGCLQEAPAWLLSLEAEPVHDKGFLS